VLCGLPEKCEHLIVAIDAATDDDKLTLGFVKSRLLQKEQCISDRGDDVKPKVNFALVNTQNVVVCGRCGKPNNDGSRCWKKHPHLRPQRSWNKQSGMVAKVVSHSDDGSDNYVCLMAGPHQRKQTQTNAAAKASESKWVIDSGATVHICNDKGMFSKLEQVAPFYISIGTSLGFPVIGRGTVDMTIRVDGKVKGCHLENVVFAPSMGYNLLSVPMMAAASMQTTFGKECRHHEGWQACCAGVVHGE